MAKDDILKAYKVLRDCYGCGGKLLIAGNGGSAADAEHIVGELMKGFKLLENQTQISQINLLRKIRSLELFL